MKYISILFTQLRRFNDHIEECSKQAKRMRSEDRHGYSEESNKLDEEDKNELKKKN
ncbi:hypothetical protein [Vibrio sp. VB16]|uniref:hypothetical protein n=1 Tax=Vibrio sp. VB16 TaxID=2785746 RepID=UPI00189FB102|nr:hypothetical protein [Vibrio sp. VB16]UGA57364.1 hypothetical protein IUZ65_017860 [Vibrio sp. VB16]